MNSGDHRARKKRKHAYAQQRQCGEFRNEVLAEARAAGRKAIERRGCDAFGFRTDRIGAGRVERDEENRMPRHRRRSRGRRWCAAGRSEQQREGERDAQFHESVMYCA